MRLVVSLRDERGQTLVFMALALGILIAIVALVVSAGDWMQTQRRAQSVADAAALAGVQELPLQSAVTDEVANSATQNDWSGSPLQTTFPDPSTVQVVAKQDVTGLFAPLAGVFNLTIQTQARASVGTPATIANVAPVGVKCDVGCQAWSGSGTFTFNRTTPGANTLAPLQLPGVQSRSDFQTFVQCDAQSPNGSCNDASATAPTSYPLLVLGPGNSPAGRLRADLRRAEGSVHLIPVFDSYSSTDGYHVVGWAVGTFSVASGGGQTVTLTITFQRMVVDGTSLVSGNGPKPIDFGVRAIALTG
jgi:Flp pilus assembly protein TadG